MFSVHYLGRADARYKSFSTEKQKRIKEIIKDCNFNNLEDKIIEVTNDKGCLKQQRGFFHTSDGHTRSEIYTLIMLYQIGSNGNFPRSAEDLSKFVQSVINKPYNITNGKKYFNEFIDLNLKFKISNGEQEYNLEDMRKWVNNQKEEFNKSIAGADKKVVFNFFEYTPKLYKDVVGNILPYVSTKAKLELTRVNKKTYQASVIIGNLKITKKQISSPKDFADFLLFLISKRCQINALDLSECKLKIIDQGHTETRFQRLVKVLKSKPRLRKLTIKERLYEHVDYEKSVAKLTNIDYLHNDRFVQYLWLDNIRASTIPILI